MRSQAVADQRSAPTSVKAGARPGKFGSGEGGSKERIGIAKEGYVSSPRQGRNIGLGLLARSPLLSQKPMALEEGASDASPPAHPEFTGAGDIDGGGGAFDRSAASTSSPTSEAVCVWGSENMPGTAK